MEHNMEEKIGDKSRRERRKEARLAKNKKKFSSWVQHQQSAKSKRPPLQLKDNAVDDCSKQTQMVEKSQTHVKYLGNNVTSNEDCSEHPSTFTNTKTKKILKRRKCLNRTPKSNFFDYLEKEMEGRGGLSAEEDLRLERRLAKKLKIKNGRLSAANDDIDVLLDGIPSLLDKLEENKKASKSVETHDLPRISNKSISGNEDLGDEISFDEGDEESDSLASSEGKDDAEVNEDLYDEISLERDDESDSLDSGEENDDVEENGDLDDEVSSEEGDEKSDSLVSSDENDEVEEVISPNDSNRGKRRKTKFEEYLEADIQGGKSLAEADLALERKLAKKLKVKAAKLQGHDDEINMLLEGIPAMPEILQKPQKSHDNSISHKKAKHSKLTEQEHPSASEVAMEKLPNTGQGKYVAPHLRSRVGNESEEYAQVRKRVRGLLNRLSETNVESITGEISTLFHEIGRNVGSQIVSEEVVASCSGGPRGNEQYAAVFGAFVAGMACLVGIDFGAKLLVRLAKCFEEEYLKEDNLSLRNLTLLLSYVYIFGVCSSELIYEYLVMLGKRLTEVDVSTVLTVLQCCGMKLRGDDPVGMKKFILSVQSRVNELKASSGGEQSNINSKRMEFMLETICDIKNNKKRSKEDTVQHTRIKKWLQKLKVDDILIRGLTWSKLIDPSKKGQWWLSGDIASTTENIEEVADTIDKEIPETKKMLQLAASQRMNTDARRAIFCVIMSSEDYVDAFEKLLRLDLPGKQDREIMRVLVECCLQEKLFNKYYCVLASKLCSHEKNHKFTLQYCLWDHFKELESMPLIRSMHLSKFTAEMIASFSVSLSVLKAVDLNDTMHLSPKRIMHFRMLFEAIFEFPDKKIWNIFTRIAVNPEYELLRNGIEFFIRKYVVGDQKSLGSKFKIVRKALNNVEGVVM